MLKLIKASVLFSVAVTTQAFADYVTVTENIANADFPTHRILIFPEQGGRGADALHLRCENNKTEAFVGVDGVFGYNGQLRVRWPDMSRATPIRAGDSTTGTAAFIGAPIPFILKLVEEKTVVFDVEGYSARGAAKFILDDPKTIKGIYALAETCQWHGRLPSIETALAPAETVEPAKAPVSETESTASASKTPTKPRPTAPASDRPPMSELELRLYLRDLKPEVRKLGLARVTEILNEVMINEK